MRNKLKELFVIICILGATLQLRSQGYIVTDGVVYVGYSGIFQGYQIGVIQNPTNGDYTAFALSPKSKTPPTVYTNTFSFSYFLDEGVRVFLVSSNDSISLQPILSHTWTELLYPNSYVFTNGIPFYVGLYTGYTPVNGVYSNPLFGWAQLVNNQGVIQMLGGALEIEGGGIYAGTQNIIPVPEPGRLALTALGILLLGFRRWKNSSS